MKAPMAKDVVENEESLMISKVSLKPKKKVVDPMQRKTLSRTI